ncbi:hypothetical protein fHeYen901_101 [Yersinia phage fHe-Yen9-01]|uniref:Uncharacterized protein n=1 Tax=Yersinia phage fHe-Yen9-01 TaxID=1965363 RepID=A0A1V0DXK6_9CAUD|nr:hypothetical protein KNT60_gp100 [Yersinia phage fHe-Yen9-01]ARB05874.1 hypothetical protein fHeYen901_101 [Yersinia phage fHe-Yen9-01]
MIDYIVANIDVFGTIAAILSVLWIAGYQYTLKM